MILQTYLNSMEVVLYKLCSCYLNIFPCCTNICLATKEIVVNSLDELKYYKEIFIQQGSLLYKHVLISEIQII